MSIKNISKQTQLYVVDMMDKEAGIKIGTEKLYLLETRLAPIVRDYGLRDIDELVEKSKTTDKTIKVRIIDALTTNETSFFRDMKPWIVFENTILPELMKKNERKKSIKIWSSAASTGQEAFTLAMICNRTRALKDWNIQIIGTDISNTVIERAKKGVYTQFEVQRGIPIKELMANFKKVGNDWEVNADLKKLVRFQTGNILSPTVVSGSFDIVFCRNLLIYFDEATKRKAVQNIITKTTQNGFLFLGGAETLMGISNAFDSRPEHHGLHQLK